MSKVTRVVGKKPPTVTPLAQLRCSACDTTFVGLGEPPANALRLNKMFLNSLEVDCPPKAHLLSSLRFCPPCTLQLNDLDLMMSELVNLKKRIENGKGLIRTKFTNVALAKEYGTPQSRSKTSNVLLVTLGDLVLRKCLATAQDSSVREIVIGDGNQQVISGPSKKTLEIRLESPIPKNEPSVRKVPEIKKADVVKTGSNSGNCSSIKGARAREGQPGQRPKSKSISQKSQKSPTGSQPVVNVRCDKYVETMFYDESESGRHENLLEGMSSGKKKNYKKIPGSWTHCEGQPGVYQTIRSGSHLSKDVIPGNPLAGRVSISAIPAVSGTPVGAALKATALSTGTHFTFTVCTLCFQPLETGKEHLCEDQNKPTSNVTIL